MNNFNKRVAIRIAVVSTVLASLASPVAWYIALESAEEGIVSLANEESGRLLHHFEAIDMNSDNAVERAQIAAKSISGGIFDIAEIYNTQGTKLAESMTVPGKAVESMIPHHGTPNYQLASYTSYRLDNGRWVLRVFVPLRLSDSDLSLPITGYFEGIRIMPTWQQNQIIHNSLTAALMVCFASLLCGLTLYPVVVHLSTDNERKAREVLDSHIAMMEALGRAIAKRDSETGAHNYRVAWIASGIAEKMGITGAAMQSLIAGSFLHDVGKIGIPDAILLKPGRLDEDEMTIMRSHVCQGKDIVVGAGWLDGAHAVVASHHEKWNGCGYPDRLQGEAIPLSARMFAVADVFDALCSKRPYKEPMTYEATMDILEKDTSEHFDPAVMTVFKPMSRHVYDRLAQCDEEGARQLLQERVRHHFEQ